MSLSIWELHNEPEKSVLYTGLHTTHPVTPPTYYSQPSSLPHTTHHPHPCYTLSYLPHTRLYIFLILLGCSNYMQSSTGDQEWKEARDRAEIPTLEANSLAPDSTDVV